MAVKIAGNTGTVAEVGGTGFRALKGQNSPIDHGANGHYRIHVVTGTLAAALAASAVVFSFRWTHGTKLAVVTKLKTRFLPLTPFTAATLTDHTSFDAFIGRSFSASHTGGSGGAPTSIFPSKMRNSMSTSNVGDLRWSTTAALGGGTVTLDTQPVACSVRKGNRVNPTAATEEVIMPQYDGMEADIDIGSGDHPIVLVTNEGIVVRNRTVWPAAGTGILSVMMAWAEVDSY